MKFLPNFIISTEFLPNFIIFTKFLNFNQISEFQPNFWISTKFQNFNRISEFQPNFRISTRFLNFNKISEFQPNCYNAFAEGCNNGIFHCYTHCNKLYTSPFSSNFCFELLLVVFFVNHISGSKDNLFLDLPPQAKYLKSTT